MRERYEVEGMNDELDVSIVSIGVLLGQNGIVNIESSIVGVISVRADSVDFIIPSLIEEELTDMEERARMRDECTSRININVFFQGNMRINQLRLTRSRTEPNSNEPWYEYAPYGLHNTQDK